MTPLVVTFTPVETHRVHGIDILVKRDDLSCPLPGPPFSKMRGVYAHLLQRPESIIGVLDTAHSKAGWAVAYVCQALGKSTINYYPKYKREDFGVYREPQLAAQALGASLAMLPAGRSAILYHKARKDLRQYPNSYLMPNALKLPESVTENAAEARRTVPVLPPSGTLVLSISSGTVAAGVIKGFVESGAHYDVILHLGYSRSEAAVRRYVAEASGYASAPIQIEDEGYEYADAVDTPCPFPCNPYYDRKAWRWLTQPSVLGPLAERGPVLFWNIGS